MKINNVISHSCIKPLLVVAFCFLSISHVSFCQSPASVKAEKLSDTLYLLKVTTSYSVNAFASIGPDGILLVDPGMGEASSQLNTVLKELGGGDIRVVIYSHNHTHHFQAVNQLTLAEDARVIAHKHVKTSMNRGVDLLEEWTDHAIPNTVIDEPCSFIFNGEKIVITPIIGSHSDGDCVIYFTQSKVVYASGLLTPDGFPYIDPRYHGNYSTFPENVRTVIDTYPDDAIFFPGHGKSCSKEDYNKFYDMLTATISIVEKEYHSGKDAASMQKDDVLGKWDSFGNGMVSKNYWIQTIVNGIEKKGIPVKKSLITPLYEEIQSNGVKAAVEMYYNLKKDHRNEYFFNESDINMLGYYFIRKENYKDAIDIFSLNMNEYPNSWNVYDSLAEAYMLSGDNKNAILNYNKSLSLNPKNVNAKKNLEEIEKSQKIINTSEKLSANNG